MTEAKHKPVAWLYRNKRGDRVVHWYADTPRFLADKAAAQEWPDAHTFTPLFDQSALDAVLAAERERCAKLCEAIADEQPMDARNSRGHKRGARVCAEAIRTLI